MAAGYKAGDKAYIVESNRIVRECTVVRPAGNLIIIRFENGGGIQVNKNRLFATKEVARGEHIKGRAKAGGSTANEGIVHLMIIGIKIS